VYSLLQRLRSLRHRFWYGISERVRWSRGTFSEAPARKINGLSCGQEERIAALQRAYQTKFEVSMSAMTALNNYEYLDILDRAWVDVGAAPPTGGTLYDVGCASFWYAAALQAFFRPHSLTGVDIEGHRLGKNGHTRVDYATGYLARLPNARFINADYRQMRAAADVITLWFPFVTSTAILAWRLPLNLLDPKRLIERVSNNLKPGGIVVMVNHGTTEADLASRWCDAAGLRPRFVSSATGVLSERRLAPPILSTWCHRPPAA